MPKVINAKNWDLTPAADGRRYSKYPDGNTPTTLATWNLPATISVPAGSSVGVRQYTANATGWTIAVTALATGLTYDSGTERIDAAVTTAASGTATFTLSKIGETDVVATATVALIAAVSQANIIRDFHFNTGNFSQDTAHFSGMPSYGRPIGYGGNGDLCWLTAETTTGVFKAGPRRSIAGDHALAMFVKSNIGGSSSLDNDGSVVSRRRTELRIWWPMFNEVMCPYLSTRWASISVHVPANFEEMGSGFGPLVWQWKMFEKNGEPPSPPLTCEIRNGAWRLDMRWSPVVNPGTGDMWRDFILAPVPESTEVEKFMGPNPEAAKTAMGNLNLGGWTDFVMQIKFDGRNVAEGGTGFIKIWMRPDGGAWTQIAHIYPSTTAPASGYPSLDHGILFKGEGTGAKYGFVPTLYMANDRVLDLSTSGHLFYFDNMKVGNENATFAEMTHDGSSP